MGVRLHGSFGSWSLPQGGCVLGRGKGADVRIDDPRLSRNHARFVLKDHHLVVEDLGSRNGVLVDGVRIIGSALLHHGQVVTCGPVALAVAIDETRLHPRRAHGSQEPGTRRNSPRSDTEVMLEAVEPPSGISALPGGSAEESSEVSHPSGLQPAPAPGSQTSPLEALRMDPHAPRAAPQPERQHGTSHRLEAGSQVTIDASALLPPDPTAEEAHARLLAGLIDGLAALAVPLGGVLLGLSALAFALAEAGAEVVDGVPRLAPAGMAGIGELFVSLFHVPGLLAGFAASPAAAEASGLSATVLVLGAALTAMLLVAGPLLVLIVPTVQRGAPAMHRRLGLSLLRARDSAPLGYGRSLLRWSAAALLWPLAIPALLLRRRAPHDVIAGCIVRQL